MTGKLSPTMINCIAMATESGGELVRYQGGYWAPRGGHPVVKKVAWHGATSISALVRCGYAEYTEHREGRHGTFPIAMQLTAKART